MRLSSPPEPSPQAPVISTAATAAAPNTALRASESEICMVIPPEKRSATLRTASTDEAAACADSSSLTKKNARQFPAGRGAEALHSPPLGAHLT